jgi:hypothetical protein
VNEQIKLYEGNQVKVLKAVTKATIENDVDMIERLNVVSDMNIEHLNKLYNQKNK